jgi:CO/xanthine dehydrogenase Mo-binding subunit
VRGGIAQGIGTALYEQYYYDADGQLLTANYADYLMPSVHELPENVRVGHVETRCARSASRSMRCRSRRAGCAP